MKYAIIKSGGKQYKVCENEELLVDKLGVQEGKIITFPEVLMVRDEDAVIIGQATVDGYKVTAKVLGEVKGKKIRVSKFKAKVRYDKTTGFRPQYTKVLIEKIEKVATRQKPAKLPREKRVYPEKSRRVDAREKKK